MDLFESPQPNDYTESTSAGDQSNTLIELAKHLRQIAAYVEEARYLAAESAYQSMIESFKDKLSSEVIDDAVRDINVVQLQDRCRLIHEVS